MQRRRFFPALGQSEKPVLSWNRFAANTQGRTYLAIRQYICRKSRYSQALDVVPFRGERTMSRATERWNKLTDHWERWSKTKPYHTLLSVAAILTGVVVVAMVVWTLLR